MDKMGNNSSSLPTERKSGEDEHESGAVAVQSCEFEVFGIVQGVSFRMYTQRKAQSLGIRGWCMNTSDGTVKGEIQGNSNAMHEMKLWLERTGSPTSRIDKCVFGETAELPQYTHEEFTIKV
ncbi:acylphosphatase-1 [Scaptodrosophila lebanonensis]|uniref:Acylphosphatase n=1 Tax=Drosophila lebanonensis TaxID=7225 RepID=A0A6J2TFM9_DROLE|nr:acylphosphatase-1 [Scaptodrosophila lebanonensis]